MESKLLNLEAIRHKIRRNTRTEIDFSNDSLKGLHCLRNHYVRVNGEETNAELAHHARLTTRGPHTGK